MRHPAGNGHVAQVAAAMDELRPRKEGRQQAQRTSSSPASCPRCAAPAGLSARSRSRCRAARRRAVGRSKPAKALDRSPRLARPARPRCRRPVGSRPRRRPGEWLARICSTSVVPDRGSPTTNTGQLRSPSRNRGRAGRNRASQTAIIRVTSDSCSCGSYSWPRLRQSASCRALARSRCPAASAYSPRASRTWARPKCRNNRCASVSSRFAPASAAAAARSCSGKFAAQEFRQFVMREGEAGIVPQRGAEGVFRALKIA